MPSVDLTIARRLLARMRTFHGRPFRITSIYGQHNEEKCFLVKVDNDSTEYKVRFATATSRRSVASEYEAFSLLSLHGIAWTPTVYEVETDEPAYLVTTYVPGESLDKSLDWITNAASIVSGLECLLSDIHGINGNFFGHLAGPRYSSWREFVEVRFWRHVMPLVSAGMISEDDHRRIRILYEEVNEALLDIRPTLLHGDVKPANIVFDVNQGMTSLVDFELARFGDIDFEWSKLQRMALRWSDYGRLIAQPLLTQTSLARPQRIRNEAKLLLYELYHACSFLDFELETGLRTPKYRITDLNELLEDVRERVR